MTFTSAAKTRSNHQTLSASVRSLESKLPIKRNQFLIVGLGRELQGDFAAGPIVAAKVATWDVNSVGVLVAQRLEKDLVGELTNTRYAIFVESCRPSCKVRTVQMCPILVGDGTVDLVPEGDKSDSDRSDDNRYQPETLLQLTQQLYGDCPQGWLIRVPTECFEAGQISSVTRRGIDRATRIVAQFLRTYGL